MAKMVLSKSVYSLKPLYREKFTLIYEHVRRLIPYQNSVGCGITNIIYIAFSLSDTVRKQNG